MRRTIILLFLAVAMKGSLYASAENNFFPRIRKVTLGDVSLLSKAAVPAGYADNDSSTRGGAASRYQSVRSRPYNRAKREKYIESEYIQYPQFLPIIPGTPVFLAVSGWTGHPPPPFVPHDHQPHSWRQRPLLIEPPLDEPIGISLPGTPTTTTDDDNNDFFNKRITGLNNRRKPIQRPTKRATKKPARKPTLTTPEPDSIQDEFDKFVLANRKKKPRPSRRPRPSRKPKPSKKPTESIEKPETETDEEELVPPGEQEAMMITAGGSDALINRKKNPRPSRKPKPSKKPTTTKKPALELPPAMDDNYKLELSNLKGPSSAELSHEDASSSEDENNYSIQVPSETDLESTAKPNTTTAASPEITDDSQSTMDGAEHGLGEYFQGNMEELIEFESSTEKPTIVELDSLSNHMKKPPPSGRPRPIKTSTPKPASEIDDSLRPDPVAMDENDESNYGYGAFKIEKPRPPVPEVMEEPSIETEDDTVTEQKPIATNMPPEEPDSAESLGSDDTLITVRRNGKPMRLRLDQVKPWELFKLPNDINWQRSLQRVQGPNYFFAS